MADISAMTADLQAYFAEHQAAVQARINAAVNDAASRASRVSSPAYGLVVDAQAIGSTVKVQVDSAPGAVGTVFGGLPAAQAEVARVIDAAMTEAGLDRRR